MANIMLRPDLRTSGGEVSDIVLHGKYAGTLTLVYREGDRISGSIQLEQESLSHKDKNAVISFARTYVQSLVDALQAKECDVLVTYSEYDHIIATESNVGRISEFLEEDEKYDEKGTVDIEDHIVDDTRFEDIDPAGRDTMDMDQLDEESEDIPVYYELVIVGEGKDRIEYHVYDEDQEWIAEAFVSIYGTDVVGEVNWMVNPTDDEIEHVTDLLVSDFDENEIETFVLDMKVDGNTIETIELAHEDLINEINEFDAMNRGEEVFENDDYSVVLTRDDEDTLTYDIYQQSHGGLPIGNATIDISHRQITGFIDFREPGSSDDREMIATLLMRELDKEKEYDSINLTMLYQNEPIDEVMFETEHVH